MVHDPPRGADDDLRSLAQRLQLALDGLAAVDGHDPQLALVGAQALELLGDLDGQLAGRAEDQRLDMALLDIDLLQQRDAEGGGLAGAGLGLADDVAALAGGGDGQRLDGRGLLEAHFRQRFLDVFGQVGSRK